MTAPPKKILPALHHLPHCPPPILSPDRGDSTNQTPHSACGAVPTRGALRQGHLSLQRLQQQGQATARVLGDRFCTVDWATPRSEGPDLETGARWTPTAYMTGAFLVVNVGQLCMLR